MIKNIQKYGAYIFLLINLLFSYKGFYQISTYLFYILSSLFLVITFLNTNFFKNVIFNSLFRMYLWIHVINLVYYTSVEFGDIESLKYLSAKSVQLFIFTFTIYFTYDRFKSDIIKFIKYICISSLFLSIIFNFPDFNSRYFGIFFNPNEFAIIMVYGFALLLIKTKNTFFETILIILFFLFIFLSGSRAAFLGVIIAFLINFNFRKISIISTLLILILVYFFEDLPTISRLVNEDIFFNRKHEIYYALETFYDEFWFGNGLKNYAYINPNIISYLDQKIDFGAHNGYLSILVQYGLIFSIAYFFIFTKNLYNALVFLRKKMKNDYSYKYFYFVLIYTLVNGLFENSFSGINFFQGSLFWLILGYVVYDVNFKKLNNENSILSN